MLFRSELKRRIRAGRVTVSFRAWKRPQVRVGGEYNLHPVGAIRVDRLRRTRLSAIKAEDAHRAGFESLGELTAELARRSGPATDLYRVEFHYLGDVPVKRPPDPDRALSEAETAELAERLGRMDSRTRSGPWTDAFLALIARRPATRAADLAAEIGWQAGRFKANVRKLKRLGLTESLAVGYRLSRRGASFVGRDPATVTRPST